MLEEGLEHLMNQLVLKINHEVNNRSVNLHVVLTG